jgi:hypothetical protein
VTRQRTDATFDGISVEEFIDTPDTIRGDEIEIRLGHFKNSYNRVGLVAAQCDVGGVTTMSTPGICLLEGDSLPSRVSFLAVVPRDASTMLSVQVPAHRYRDPPTSEVLSPLGCENLGSERSPFHYGGGLLPDSIDKKTCVLTPGVYHAPKGKWALRPLTVEEVIVAKDFGRSLPPLLGIERLDNCFLHTLVPRTSLVALAMR